MEDGEYVKNPANTVNRHGKDYAKYDADLIHSIVNTTSVLHVSFVPDPSDPTPVILPMIGQIGTYPPSSPSSPPAIYLHGYVTSRLMRLGASASSEGISVCVCATKVDGLVLALTPFSHSCNYRSAILHGRAYALDDSTEEGAQEKLWAMELVTNGVVARRWENTRVPPDGGELQSTRILKVEVESASAKVRDFGPKYDRKDLKREEVVEKVWTGVVPVQEVMLEPIPAESNKVGEVPGYLKEYVEERNAEAREYALKTASTEAPGRKKRED
ncbi:MAG: hypothetical protein Q9165_007299 [Trypethelium subeluteriae]